MNTQNFYVYGLFYEDEQGDDICFYIGKGTGNRKDEHFKEWCLEREADSHKTSKIRKLKSNNVPLSSKILAGGLTNQEAINLEKALLLGDEVFNKLVNKSKNSTGGILKPLPKRVKNKLGEVPDTKLAKNCNVCAQTIYRKRNRLGIDAWSRKKEVPKECIEEMGEISDSKLAKKYKISQTTISKKRKELGIEQIKLGKKLPKELEKKLGEVPDGEIAKKCNLSGPTVARKRKERNIEPYKWWK